MKYSLLALALLSLASSVYADNKAVVVSHEDFGQPISFKSSDEDGVCIYLKMGFVGAVHGSKKKRFGRVEYFKKADWTEFGKDAELVPYTVYEAIKGDSFVIDSTGSISKQKNGKLLGQITCLKP
jgi:hypothetical protein